MSRHPDYIDEEMMEEEMMAKEEERGPRWPYAQPFTGYRDFLESGAYERCEDFEPRSLASFGQGPERFYSHGVGDSDRFYGSGFDDEMREYGWSRDMAQGPRGRMAPYTLGQTRRFARRRH